MNNDKIRSWVGKSFALPIPKSEAIFKKKMMKDHNMTSDEYEQMQEDNDREKYEAENNDVTQQEIDEARNNLTKRGYILLDDIEVEEDE